MKNKEEVVVEIVAEDAKETGKKANKKCYKKVASIQDRLSQITGKTTEINQQINNDSEGSHEKIEELFKAATKDLKIYEETTDEGPGIVGRMFGKKPLKQVRFASYQESINKLFDTINLELHNTMKVGETFQEMCITIEDQLPELMELKEESDAQIASFENPRDVPMGLTKTNSQIIAEIERLKDRLMRLEAGIMASRGTVMELSAKLPAIKAGIEDETAFGLELNKMTNVYSRVREAAQILTDISNSNSEAIHGKVIEILDEQKADTTMITYVRNRHDAGERLAKDVAERAEDLAKKAREEADEIKAKSQASLAYSTQNRLKQLNS